MHIDFLSSPLSYLLTVNVAKLSLTNKYVTSFFQCRSHPQDDWTLAYGQAEIFDSKQKFMIHFKTFLTTNLCYMQLNIFYCSVDGFALKSILFDYMIKTQK